MISNRQALVVLFMLAVLGVAGAALLLRYPLQETRVYHIAAADLDTPTDLPPSLMPQSGSGDGGAADLHWHAPDHWQPAPARNMILAAYRVPGAAGAADAEFTVSTFPGDVGGDLANLNRWRTQLGLDALSPDQLADAYTTLSTPAGPMKLADLRGADQQTLSAWIQIDGATWFLKLSGPAATVTAERDAFLQVLRETHPVGDAAEAHP